MEGFDELARRIIDESAAAAQQKIDSRLESELRRMLPDLVRAELRAALFELAQSDQPAAGREGTSGDGKGPQPDSGAKRQAIQGGEPSLGSSSVGQRGRQRVELTDDFLKQIADEYRQAVAAGEHPTKTLCDRYDKSRSSVSAWLKEARDRELLPPTTQGRIKA